MLHNAMPERNTGNDLCFYAVNRIATVPGMNLRKTIGTCLLLGLNLQCFAATIYWANTSNGLYNVATNWQGGIAPSNTDSVSINNGGTAVIDSTMTLSNVIVQVGDTNATTGNLIMTGGSLTLSSDLRAGGNGGASGNGTGIFELDAGTVLQTGGNMNIGFGTNSVGTYNIYGGSIQNNSASPIFAVGNKGTATVNQTNGTIYLRNINGLMQLGRNSANTSSSGTYNLSGGTLAAAKISFGAVTQTSGPLSAETFNLSGTGTLICNSIAFSNAAAANSFNFTGGTLSLTTSRISITNNGGIFSPSTADFSSAAGTNLASLPINPIGTATFSIGNTYIQATNGTLAIDIAGDTSFDFVSIDTNLPFALGSSIDGNIAVNLLNGYVPAVGQTFDIVKAINIASTAKVIANNGAAFSATVVDFLDPGGIGFQKLRLTVTTQPVSTPQLSATVVGSSVQVAFTNTPGHAFSVLASSTAGGSFTKVGTTTESPAGQYQFNDTLGAVRFYRVTFP